MQCAFCGETKARRTREHIFPRWMLDEFGWDKDYVTPTHFDVDGNVVSDRWRQMNRFIAGPVCEDCNCGWMADLEGQNQRLVTELARGELDLDDIEDDVALGLARWSFKTALTLHMAANWRRVVPPDHYRYVWENASSLPEGVHVVGRVVHFDVDEFGWYESTSWWIQQEARVLSAEELTAIHKRAYKVTLQLSDLLLNVAFNPLVGADLHLWRGQHVLLHPRPGRVAWYEREGDLPNHAGRARTWFHGSLGLVSR